MAETVVYHITTAREVEVARDAHQYASASFEAEGFIHCSRASQVRGVANRLFRGRRDLVVLEIDPCRVPHDIVEENLGGGRELFPHIYGRVPIPAIVRVHLFPCREDGQFDLPAGIEAGDGSTQTSVEL